MHVLRSLLSAGIDYAGLFPPAALDMTAAVSNYAEYRRSPERWALGRFVVPAARLGELETAIGGVAPPAPADDAWPLAVILGNGSPEEIGALGEFNCRHAGEGAAALSGDVVEVKADSVAAIERLAGTLPRYLQAYIEVPISRDPSDLVAAIRRAGARAKVRTGGVTPNAFPSSAELARFLRACAEAGVPCKATAGLHHPLRAEYRLTYEPDSPRGTMYGFLNVFLAAAFARAGMNDGELARLLEERDPASIRFDEDHVDWRGHRLDEAAIRGARESGIASFGSCSFTEPIEELRSLHLLPAPSR